MSSETITLCVSLGGSHAEVGMLNREGFFIGSGAFSWRDRIPTRDPTAVDLASTVAKEARALLNRESRSAAFNLGVAFPGPRGSDGWVSNNLTPDFRAGRPVDSIFASCFRAAIGREPQSIAVALDAQADAGGELYHPRGRLADIPLNRGATVINVASGVAAGYVFKARNSGRYRVACTAPDFCEMTGERYDEGAGHLGRHVVIESLGDTWRYEYRSRGGIASNGRHLRMTDVLSGPALAAQLALRLAREGVSTDVKSTTVGPILEQAKRLITEMDSNEALRTLGQKLRTSKTDDSGKLLEWADTLPFDSGSSDLCAALRTEFVLWNESFAGALAAWQQAPGWDPVSHDIVMTGGVGQRLLQRSFPAFWDQCSLSLRPGTRIMRSTLIDGCERAAWFFQAQAFRVKEC